MDKMTDVIAGAVFVIVVGLILIAIAAVPTMWLWNLLMPDLFGLQTITFTQAVCMNLLATILFKPIQFNSNKNS